MPWSALNKRDTVWYIYLLSVIKIPTIQLHIQGVNEGLIGVDKQPISNWIYESIFPIEFMLTAKFIFLFFVLDNVLFIHNIFFGLFNQVPF